MYNENIIVLVQSDEKSDRISFNLKKYVKMNKVFKVDSKNNHKFENLFQGKLNYLNHVFRCRIIDFQAQNTDILDLPEALTLKVYSYLGLKELFKIAMLSTNFRKRF